MKKVFFTGHRTNSFYTEDMLRLVRLLKKFVSEGVVDFYAGGAKGWDTTFADFVLRLRKNDFPSVKLHLVLPCPPEEQTARWNKCDKEMYQEILAAADSVEIVSDHYDRNCMKKRNERLVELGDVCICYYDEKRFRSGTGQTVRLAEKMEKKLLTFLTKYANNARVYSIMICAILYDTFRLGHLQIVLLYAIMYMSNCAKKYITEKFYIKLNWRR